MSVAVGKNLVYLFFVYRLKKVAIFRLHTLLCPSSRAQGLCEELLRIVREDSQNDQDSPEVSNAIRVNRYLESKVRRPDHTVTSRSYAIVSDLLICAQ